MAGVAPPAPQVPPAPLERPAARERPAPLAPPVTLERPARTRDDWRRQVPPGRRVALGPQVPPGRRVAPPGAAVRPAPQERPEGAVALPAVRGERRQGRLERQRRARWRQRRCRVRRDHGDRRCHWNVCATHDLQMDVDGCARSAKIRVGFAQGLQQCRLQQSAHRLHVDGRQLGGLRRSRDDLHRLAPDGHGHPDPSALRRGRADADLFQAEEHLGSHVRVGPVGFHLSDLDGSHQRIELERDRTSSTTEPPSTKRSSAPARLVISFSRMTTEPSTGRRCRSATSRAPSPTRRPS